MKHFKTYPGLVAAGVLGLCAHAAQAGLSSPNYESFESIKVTSGQTATVNAASAIHVRSNGSEYTQASGSHVTYLIGGSVKVSKNKWRVFNVKLGIGALAVMNDGTLLDPFGNGHFENFGSFHSAGVNEYPTKHYSIKDYPLQVPLGSSGLGHFAVQRCNAHKLGLQQQGVSKIAIFNLTRHITIPVAFHFAAQVNDKDKEEEYNNKGALAHGAGTIGVDQRYWRQATMWQSVNVVCEKSPDLPVAAPKDPTPIPTGSNDIAIARGVTQSFLSLTEKSKPAGACSVKLSGVITTNLPNTTVTIAYRNHKGVETPSRTLKTDHSSTVMFVDDIHFNQGQGEGPSLTTPVATPAPGNPTGSFAPNVSTAQYSGWYQIVGKNIKFQSNMAEYNFSCQDKPPGGIQAASPSPTPLLMPGARLIAPAAPRALPPGLGAAAATPMRAVPAQAVRMPAPRAAVPSSSPRRASGAKETP